jgi:hypothetical protein
LAGPTEIHRPGTATPKQEGRGLAVVFYVGGVTYAEIAALRIAVAKRDMDLLVCTTKVFNGSSLMTSLMHGG